MHPINFITSNPNYKKYCSNFRAQPLALKRKSQWHFSIRRTETNSNKFDVEITVVKFTYQHYFWRWDWVWGLVGCTLITNLLMITYQLLMMLLLEQLDVVCPLASLVQLRIWWFVRGIQTGYHPITPTLKIVIIVCR